MVLVWRIKKEGKKEEGNAITIFSQYILSGKSLLVNIDEKKNNFFRKRKKKFNSMFKLKSVSIFITNVFTILSQ